MTDSQGGNGKTAHMVGLLQGQQPAQPAAHEETEVTDQFEATGQTESLDQTDCQRPVIMVAYASVGSGHRSAASAVAQAFRKLRDESAGTDTEGLLPANCEIELVDILDYGYVRFDGEETTNLFVGPTRPLYDIAWHYTFTGRILWGGGTIWSDVMFRPFTEHVRRRKPLAIVATHIVAANAAVSARMVTGQMFPITIVPTDYGFEGFWPCRYADLICAADDLMVSEILPRRVPIDKVRVTGIPVKEGFDREYDRDVVLERFGLPSGKMIVLVMAGAKWRQPYVHFRQAMDELFPHLDDFPTLHFVFICGSDEEYALELETKKDFYDVDNVTVLGYVNDMPQLMSVADLALAKSGGLTVTECICARLPLLLVGTSYGQERANTETVVRSGAGQQTITPYDVMMELTKIDENHGIVELMRQNGETLRRPHAARDVALETLFKVGTTKRLPKPFMHFFWGGRPVRAR